MGGLACAAGHRRLPGGVVSLWPPGRPVSAQTSWPTLGVTGCKAQLLLSLSFRPAPFQSLLFPNTTLRIPGEDDESKGGFFWIFIINTVQRDKQA